jgi:CRISPR system Cascade subunit CasA
MAALGQNRVHALPGLQRHQEDAFHVFLCCLAGAILARKGDTDPEQTADEWCQGLQTLAGPNAQLAWTLVVADPAQPAFMQPPVVPEAEAARLKPHASSPDQLDILPTAKNHDVKSARAADAEVDEWIHALISLQTMSGYFGSGNQGISRMNGGFGSRSVAEVLHTDTPGGRFQDAVIRLLDWRPQVLDGSWGYDPQGVVLVWILP